MLSLYIKLQILVSSLLRERNGQATTEYALMLFFMVLVILAATRMLGSKVTSVLSTVANSV